ncbi:unnamed protein product [Schistosoma mattheei]|uniref:Uncharacterized protein n=1 Tax=Schistosoma mattheei TaxID=31246 RepID=A0A3P8GJE7_9TREM|nr:unnamed protein product [Schistosoma mattheei]
MLLVYPTPYPYVQYVNHLWLVYAQKFDPSPNPLNVFQRLNALLPSLNYKNVYQLQMELDIPKHRVLCLELVDKMNEP